MVSDSVSSDRRCLRPDVSRWDLGPTWHLPTALPLVSPEPDDVDMTNPRIVTVGIDGSETSAVALGWAAREASRRGALLQVIHAYTIPVYGGDFGAVMAFPSVDLEEFQVSHQKIAADQLAPIRASYPELTIETVVESGPPITSIVEGAKDAELVVVGTHGAGSLAALIIGSVARGVAHRAPCPVVLVPNIALRSTVERIVVGTDGSPAADAAMDWADNEARLWDAELTVAHACYYPYHAGHVTTGGGAALMEVDAMMLLSKAGHRLDTRRGGGNEVRTILLPGPPATALVETAADSDLLVVGTRGRGGLKAALLGSTSNQAIHHARCPIAVIHTPPVH